MPLDADDLKKLSEMIAAGVKAAVDPLAAKVDPAEIGKIVKAHVAEGTKGLVSAEDLAKREADAKKAADDAAAAKAAADAEAAGKGKGKGSEPDPAVAALEAKIALLTKQAADAQEAAKAEREKARTTALHSATRAALTKNGIPEDKVDLALDVLKARGVLTYDGDTPGWKGKNDVGLEAVLPLDVAAGAWMKAEGKHFLPPVDIGGTGDGAGKSGGRGNSNDITSLAQLRAHAGGSVINALANHGG